MRSSLQLQKSIGDVLKSDSQLIALMGGVVQFYDYVVEEAQPPYITYIEDSVNELDTTTTRGFRHLVTLHVWSDYEGTAEVRGISSRIYELLHLKTDLVTELATVITVEFKFQDVVKDPDGQMYHGVIRFEITTDSTED